MFDLGQLRVFRYDEIKHTLPFDNYIHAHPYLTGHRSVSHMPLHWNPHAVTPGLRPFHRPELADERGLPLNDDADGSDLINALP